jgi:hypothetical protein
MGEVCALTIYCRFTCFEKKCGPTLNRITQHDFWAILTYNDECEKFPELSCIARHSELGLAKQVVNNYSKQLAWLPLEFVIFQGSVG